MSQNFLYSDINFSEAERYVPQKVKIKKCPDFLHPTFCFPERYVCQKVKSSTKKNHLLIVFELLIFRVLVMF